MNRKGYGRKWLWSNLMYYAVIFLEELRKIKKNIRIVYLLAEI
jgi:hypothetical protein